MNKFDQKEEMYKKLAKINKHYAVQPAVHMEIWPPVSTMQ